MKKIILASNSFRRREILSKLGYKFDVKVPDIEEDFSYDLPAIEVIKKISYEKAKKVLENNISSIVIAGDTAVVLDGVIMGKPERDLEKKYGSSNLYKLLLKDEKVFREAKDLAYKMLKKMSGRTHEVITGICIMSSKKVYLDATVSKVTFSELTDKEINDYIEEREPFGKAGGYALQENAGKFVKHIDGDFFSIVGFPLNLVYQELKNINEY